MADIRLVKETITTSNINEESPLSGALLTDVYEAVSEVAQLALEVNEGDTCKRTDEDKTYVAKNSTNSTMADWLEISASGGEGGTPITTYEVATEVAQLALSVNQGDHCIRTDESKVYINLLGNNTAMSDWDVISSVSVLGASDHIVYNAITDSLDFYVNP